MKDLTASAVVAKASSCCPHDCPSCCALKIDILADGRIGRLHGDDAHPYTNGVICAKVARYAERLYHPDRVLHPLRRVGAKGEGCFERISWDEALDEIGRRFNAAEREFGAESVWLHQYGGTMGQVQGNSINRLRHVKRYSGIYGTYCVAIAWSGYGAAVGKIAGIDPLEMLQSDCLVIWGTNAVATQVNVMTHAARARKARGTRIVVVDVYENDTMKQADLALLIRPGTDAALACAVMHVLFRDGLADRAYMARYADCPDELEAHLAPRTPQWAAAITGLAAERIEEFARLVGARPRTFWRVGYGFTRSRNGAASMHAVLSIPTVAGHWQYEGGGVYHASSGMFHFDRRMIAATDLADPSVRMLDQSRTGDILTGDTEALLGGPPIKAMLVQSTNPATVAPEQAKVRAGLSRDDLFLVVHEHFVTETALYADIVLPATQFVEHDDLYRCGGETWLTFGARLVEPAGEAVSNHDLISAIAARVGAEHPGFRMSARAHVAWLLEQSGYGTLDELIEKKWLNCQADFASSHFLGGFGHADGRFHFRADWSKAGRGPGLFGPVGDLPALPDYVATSQAADDEFGFRLVTAPARGFLNSSFSQTSGSARREGRPEVMIHPADAGLLDLAGGDLVELASPFGAMRLHCRLYDGVRRGVLIAEGLHPASAHVGGGGINMLTGSDPVAPSGGVGFHDTKVRVRRIN